MRYSCGHVSTKKNVRGLKDAAASTPPPLRSSRYIRYRDNIGYPQYGESYNIGDNQYSSKNLSYCPINRFLESVTLLTYILMVVVCVVLTVDTEKVQELIIFSKLCFKYGATEFPGGVALDGLLLRTVYCLHCQHLFVEIDHDSGNKRRVPMLRGIHVLSPVHSIGPEHR